MSDWRASVQAGALLLAALIATGALAALPESKVAALAVRALAYDRNLKARVGPRLDILVVHDGSRVGGTSALRIMEGMNALQGVSVAGAPLSASAIAVADADSLNAALDARGPDAVWLCSGSESLLTAVVAAGRARSLTTMTGNADFVAKGIMLGVDGAAEKPRMLVHLTEARAAGVDFAADLLKLATVTR